ncbi:hypothetical protein PPEP_a1553 [Pseudoalteromonas peptidolytica F12-50-A1]|uniref:Uncharacterized protein n=1 Tax=Pseudoalteromonas peptidolytica F12-50-A1 TaxID=1315280 RepID=A0A8I0MWF2_9GAMM|nr:hypothetical protein [Pseudoalteromonas peptidolytica F12-50-A1]
MISSWLAVKIRGTPTSNELAPVYLLTSTLASIVASIHTGMWGFGLLFNKSKFRFSL